MTGPRRAAGFLPTDIDHLRLVADSIPHIVWIATSTGSTEYFNQQGVVYSGRPPEANYGRNKWAGLVHPDDAERAQAAWEDAVRTQTPYSLDYRLRRADGQYRWHAFRAHPMIGPGNAFDLWIGTATDIEDAKQAETDLRMAHREAAEVLTLLETILSKAPVGLAFVDREFRVVRLNETLATLNGSTVAKLLGESVPSVVGDSWPEIERLYRRVLDDGEAVTVEVEDPPGADTQDRRHWLTSYYPVRLEDEIIGVGVVVIDITERRVAEENRRQLAAIVEGSGDAIIGVTTDGVVTSWNAGAEDLFWYTAEEMIGQPIARIVPQDLAGEQVGMRTRLNAGGPTEHLETKRSRRDGSLVDVLLTASTATDGAGRVVGLAVTAHDIAERRAIQGEREASRHQLAVAQRIAKLGSFELDLLTGQMAGSEELYRLFDLDRAVELTVDLLFSLVHTEDLPGFKTGWCRATDDGVPLDLVHRIIRSSSQLCFVHARVVPEISASGAVVKLFGTLTDETDRVEANRSTQAAERRFEASFEQAGIGAAVVDLGGLPLRVNPAACALFGRPADLLVGRRWIDYTHPDEVPLLDVVLKRVAAGHDNYADERRFIRPDGTIVWASCHVTLARDPEGLPQFFLVQLQDIRSTKQLEETLAHKALHDELTGLPNRALLSDRLIHGLAGSRRRGSRLGVVFLDLDNFKATNDSFGHTSGDDLLKETAGRIQDAIRDDDTVARVGGDEFVVVCDDVSALETHVVAQRILEGLRRPIRLANQDVAVTASLGIAVAGPGATPDTLLRDADLAMYSAKQAGGGHIEVFDEQLRSEFEQRLSITAALHHGLERHEFTIHYQPIVDLASGRMVSAEALVRWHHPDGTLVGPDAFVPIAEETGLIVPIGAWVLEQACRDLVSWQRADPSMTMAVNLSVRQVLSPGLVELVNEILERTGASPTDLSLELTESLLMDDLTHWGTTLGLLKEIGIGLVIDDFGTGYSSLGYLKRFPFDAVKVDRTFVDGLGTDAHDTALVGAIIAMADALNLETIAEGVETLDQAAALGALKCHRAQGFYFARPMIADDVSRLVVEAQRLPSVTQDAKPAAETG